MNGRGVLWKPNSTPVWTACIARANEKSVKQIRRVHPGSASGDHVIAVLLVVDEPVLVVGREVSTQDGAVKYRVTLVKLRLGTCEASVDQHAVIELECGFTITRSPIRRVDALRHPDIDESIGGCSRIEGVL